jgi:hypothetical protein
MHSVNRGILPIILERRGLGKPKKRGRKSGCTSADCIAGNVAGAGDGIRTRDINLGKVALYQLSYSRVSCIVALDQDNVKSTGDASGTQKRPVNEMFYYKYSI